MDKYYYLDSDYERKGPFSLEELLQEPVNDTTLIWRKGLTEWTPAAKVAEVVELLPKSPSVPVFTTTEPQPDFEPQPETQPFVQSVAQPYAPPAGEELPPCPPTNLVWGILTTFCCCTPLGIVSIYMATRVNYFYNMGQYDQAKKYSEKAANWAIASIVIAILFMCGYLGLFSFTTFLTFLSVM